MNKTFEEYKKFCREIALTNFALHWEYDEEITKVQERSQPIDYYDYRCTIKINGESSKMVYRSFFNEEVVWNLGKKSLPWEKNLELKMALSLFEEFNNIMGASFKRSLEAVDCLDLEVPKAKKMGNEKVFLAQECDKHEVIIRSKSHILKDDWEVVFPEGTILNSLRTEIFDTEKFKKADFNSENIYASKGNTFFL
ncbi:hypothetical protein OAK75_00605 [Bacteriovoracales bacterium]|nr:hypothetical protein [Bacteriovoracales bacterium]